MHNENEQMPLKNLGKFFASAEEIGNSRRSRSAILRIAQPLLYTSSNYEVVLCVVKPKGNRCKVILLVTTIAI
jgi:hypothetical protein